MTSRMATVAACALAVLTVRSGVSAQSGCDRACLKTMLDQYLNAVIKHDPSAAPLLVGFRQTENAVVVKLGDGIWKTVTGLGKLQRRYMDPVTGQAAFYGIVEEGTSQAIVTARVRVENRKITEAEWLIARNNEPGLNGQPGGNLFNPDGLIASPPPERTVPPAARASRDTLLAITNSYFDGITSHDGSIILAHPGCTRVENGTGMTGRAGRAGAARGAGAAGGADAPRGGGGAPVAGGPAPATDCTSGLQTINIQMVAARRYPIVDEEASVVLAIAVFIRRPGTPTRRNVFSEWFAIDSNRIRTIHTAMFYPPPELPVPNWPPYEGNWPLPATFAAPDASGR